MPSISEFFGVTIYMYYAHGKHKLPYFHARYQGQDASFSIKTQEVMAGHLPIIRRYLNTFKVQTMISAIKVLATDDFFITVDLEDGRTLK